MLQNLNTIILGVISGIISQFVLDYSFFIAIFIFVVASIFLISKFAGFKNTFLILNIVLFLFLMVILIIPNPPFSETKDFNIVSPADKEYLPLDEPFEIKGQGKKENMRLVVNDYRNCADANLFSLGDNNWVFYPCSVASSGTYKIRVVSEGKVQYATQTIEVRIIETLTFWNKLSNFFQRANYLVRKKPF